ncbi:LysR family transcriptional regulator [Marinomonas mediterranea]|uniref:LysR family transcriptional regulator n=1 Tax=Marinomonas mediterranea TaxID=119864 RepID=UPI00234982BE|nr:LysR family transcriptional regulator [Marinomonas mediterranea]WCN08189.1 LysR family transcriptional regulator [Marinomonas mediterranea]
MIRTDDLKVFIYSVEEGSFSAAAKRLGSTPALASSAIQRLEKAVGARLFIRSTRTIRLSEDGERYLAHARAAIDALDAGERELNSKRDDISGTLRISAPSDLGRNVLLPWLQDFQDTYPDLSIDLRLGDHISDLYKDTSDVGIRYGVLGDSSLIALPLVPDNRRIVCASPVYLDQYGTPASIEALRRHNCLLYQIAGVTYDHWPFILPDGNKTIKVKGTFASDDADVVKRWGIAGKGVLYKSRLDILNDIKAGSLVQIFPTDHSPLLPLQLVCPHRTSITPAIKKLTEFLRERFHLYLS